MRTGDRVLVRMRSGDEVEGTVDSYTPTILRLANTGARGTGRHVIDRSTIDELSVLPTSQMGALCTTDPETGEHVATGKAEPAGTRHEPAWSVWSTEGYGLEFRFCLHDECDVEDWRRARG